jgi:hypothetical protein
MSSYVLPAALVKAMRHDGQGKLFAARAATEGQLATALQQAFSADKADHLAFIEVCWPNINDHLQLMIKS